MVDKFRNAESIIKLFEKNIRLVFGFFVQEYLREECAGMMARKLGLLLRNGWVFILFNYITSFFSRRAKVWTSWGFDFSDISKTQSIYWKKTAFWNAPKLFRQQGLHAERRTAYFPVVAPFFAEHFWDAEERIALPTLITISVCLISHNCFKI